jgi:hypothetical protein
MPMGFLSHFLYPWGLILQGLAVVHFIRRRPDNYWIFVILFLGPIGAAIYLFAEVLPDLGLARHSLKGFSRRKRIGQLQIAIRDNPSTGNYEELGDLYLEEGKLQRARDAYDKSIAARANTIDVYPDHDFYRDSGLLAHAYALTGQKEKAEALFQRTTAASTLSETYLNFASLLASEGRNAEAREWIQKVLDKKPTMPGYQRRRERPWFRSAVAMLKRLPA